MTSPNSAPGTSGYNPAWYAAASIFIDPENVSGTASNSNNGTSSSTAILTWAEAIKRWGSTTPILTTSQTITFLSSHTDNSDPVVFSVKNGNASTPVITSSGPTTVTAGVVLAGVVAKNRAVGTNSPLIATLGATAAVGMLVINTTGGKASRARVMRLTAGTTFELSQPLAPQSLATAGSEPAEVDTWANGDTVTLANPIAVNLAVLECSPIDANNPSFNNPLIVFNVDVFDPLGAGNDTLYSGLNVWFLEVLIQKFWSPTATLGLYFQCLCFNVVLGGGGFATGMIITFSGGGCLPTSNGAIDFVDCHVKFDGDYVQEEGIAFWGGTMRIGFMYSGTGNIDIGQEYASQLSLQTLNYGGHVLYGRAGSGLKLEDVSRGVCLTGTWVAGITAPGMVTGITMNGGTTAQTHTNATPDVVTSGVATTPTNADAATGGNMLVWGGASLSKAG